VLVELIGLGLRSRTLHCGDGSARESSTSVSKDSLGRLA